MPAYRLSQIDYTVSAVYFFHSLYAVTLLAQSPLGILCDHRAHKKKKNRGHRINPCPQFQLQIRNNASHRRRGSDLHSLVRQKGLEPPTY